MKAINEITPEQIVALKDIEAAKLLLKLLTLEAARNHQPLSGVSVPLNITVADGGEDARVEWKNDPQVVDWIPNKYTMFQIKATEMRIQDCKKEILREDKKSGKVNLKPKVREVFEKKGWYILFYTSQALVKKGIDERIEAIREGIEETGEADHATAQIKIYDANLIAQWTNVYPQAVVFVYECLKLSRHILLETWGEWGDRDEYSIPFIRNNIIETYLNDIRKALATSKNVLRLVGLSGLGKTRLVFEAFRSPSDDKSGQKVFADDVLDQKMLSDSVMYYNAITAPANLRDYIVDLATRGCRGILIIDNCDLELHKNIADEVKQRNKCQLSLLTIDSNPERVNKDEPFIRLKPKEFEDIIPNLLREVIKGIPEKDINRIQEFAQGFPLVAVLLAKDRDAKSATLGQLNDDILVEKMLGKDLDDETRNVIRACAIFEKIGFEDDLTAQRDFIATNDLLSKLDGSENSRKNKFYEACTYFIKRGIIEKRGRTISVRPRPLALRLAADWWENCLSESVPEILSDLVKAGLAEALCDQMALLDFLPKAREITRDLCGEQGPFGQAKAFNTELGSRLFRSLVVVNPEACTEAISRAFLNYSIDQLKEVGPGRRNIVWSLEKLCFWENTFPKAARLMLSFAAAENESWGNNATNQFLQLYHTFLSGTQAPPSERLRIVDEASAKEEVEYKNLAVRALGHVLQTHNFTRSGGVETQGSRLPQEEWKPKLWKDAFDYWHEALVRLIPIACKDDELAKTARDQIAHSIRGLVSYGRMDDIENALKTIVEKCGPLWPEALESVREAIRFEGPKVPKEGLERLVSWEILLQPKDIASRLKQIICIPSWHHVKKEEDGHYTDLADIEAVELANELLQTSDSLFEFLPLLFEGEQRKGFIFGLTLGEKSFQPKKFIEESLRALRNIDASKANSDVLAGFLRALRKNDPVLVRDTLDKIVQDEKLLIHAVNITRYVVPTFEDLQRLITVIRSGKIAVRSLKIFSYGRALSHLKPEEVISFCEQISQFNGDGALCALDLLYMYSFQDPNLIKACRNELRKIMLTLGLLELWVSSDQMDVYHWQEVAKIILKEDGDLEFAIHLAKEIVRVCEQEGSIYGVEHAIGEVLDVLLSDFLKETWPIFGEALLSDQMWLHHNVAILFEGKGHFGREEPSILTNLPIEFLMSWAKTNEEKVPKLLGRMTPLFSLEQGNLSWHPLAKALIDDFGTRKEVLSSLTANFIGFGWMGSPIPDYEQRIKALELLKNHPTVNVRSWAQNLIERFQHEIINEKKREEEELF